MLYQIHMHLYVSERPNSMRSHRAVFILIQYLVNGASGQGNSLIFNNARLENHELWSFGDGGPGAAR